MKSFQMDLNYLVFFLVFCTKRRGKSSQSHAYQINKLLCALKMVADKKNYNFNALQIHRIDIELVLPNK